MVKRDLESLRKKSRELMAECERLRKLQDTVILKIAEVTAQIEALADPNGQQEGPAVLTGPEFLRT
jgi:hypothetical protein